MQNRYVFFFVLLAVGMHPWGIIADNAQEKNATSLRKKVMYGAIVTLAIGGVIYCLRPGSVLGGAIGAAIINSSNPVPVFNRFHSGGLIPVIVKDEVVA